jgi:hypothetical protein
MRNVPDNSRREYQNTHFVFSDYYQKSYLYEITWILFFFFAEECKKLLRFKLMYKFNRTYPVVFYLLLASKYWD